SRPRGRSRGTAPGKCRGAPAGVAGMVPRPDAADMVPRAGVADMVPAAAIAVATAAVNRAVKTPADANWHAGLVEPHSFGRGATSGGRVRMNSHLRKARLS